MDKELSTLKKAQKLGAEKAQSLTKALGLSIAVVKDDEVVSISSDGEETKIGKVAFGRVKVTKKVMLLNDQIKKLRVFAGPNGSGKTTIINEIRNKYNVGSFVNADIIQEGLNRLGYLDYSEFCDNFVSASEWSEFLHICERDLTETLRTLKFSDYHLLISKNLNSYEAAVIADFFRAKLIKSSNTFSYEIDIKNNYGLFYKNQNDYFLSKIPSDR